MRERTCKVSMEMGRQTDALIALVSFECPFMGIPRRTKHCSMPHSKTKQPQGWLGLSPAASLSL